VNIQQYLIESSRTCPNLGSDLNNQIHMAIGSSTEANELLDAYKKWFAYDKVLDKVNVAEEIGDSFWYLINLCRMLELDPEEIMANNIKKLQTRYPEKFSTEKALHRDLGKERKVLEELPAPPKPFVQNS
jgi:NTP pyrophosphatase (non-canonical NTP hydrolase)